MYVIALCGPIGANLKQLAKQISETIQFRTVEIVKEDEIRNEKGEYVVTDLIAKIKQKQGVCLLVGHFFLVQDALEKAFDSALKSKSKEEAESAPSAAQATEKSKTGIIDLKLFLKTDSDQCYQHYLLEKLHGKNLGHPKETKGAVNNEAVDSTETRLADILQINQEYGKSIKPINDTIINPSQKQAHVMVHDSANQAIICTLINSIVNPVPVEPVFDEEQKPDPEPIGPRFFS
ncbi:hypothetical protein DIZ81_00090 [Legionella taurinensis]|uniref:Uncharacterized protein n=1 Tax=Legionella taurinensis TaxID=70611 RepID=A0AB38N938_9GAMM|nr:hypothetical protein [Legionella taurinensis]MDX1836727.1 hypothetical protein [Legionella taurinensis]PUT42820.1 hypothetical protein DB744_00090 [Legionella taurinensis]PUT45375.1 hypothetical protein DB746_00090 [Legionella taurinensis]PUT47050.1 hypothetical protein DB743_03910 [Legionella taurinensis]PUT49142.1 hypothetical protein DB745_00090 [Legionella taurinensis]